MRLTSILLLFCVPAIAAPGYAQVVLLDVLGPELLDFPPQPDDDTGPQFGAAVAASQDWLLVGIPRYLFHTGIRPGADAAFQRVDDHWGHVETGVPVSPPESWDEAACGRSVAIAERPDAFNHARDRVRGCPAAAVLGPNPGGAAFMHTTPLPDGPGSGLVNYSQQAGDQLGYSVAVAQTISGEAYAAFGAPGGEYVRVYRRPAGSVDWQFSTVLTAANGTAGDRFGHSVAVGTGSLGGAHVFVVVGAPQRTNLAGAAYVFYRGSSTEPWSQIGQLQPPAQSFGDLFGASVAFRSGASFADNRIAVGAQNRYTDGNSGLDHRRGTVSIFAPSVPLTNFVHQGDVRFNAFLCTVSPTVCANTQQGMGFGTALAFDAGGIWIGAPGYDQADGADVGRVYRAEYGSVFGDTAWWVRSMLSPGPLSADCVEDPNQWGRAGGRFGSALAATASTIAVGYPGRGCVLEVPPYTADPRRGQVRIFGRSVHLFADGFEAD
jgi:hypothetical protein